MRGLLGIGPIVLLAGLGLWPEPSELEVGTLEHVDWEFPFPRYATPSVLLSNRHLRDVLDAKGYTFTYHEYAGPHDSLVWRGRFGDDLIAMIGVPDSASSRVVSAAWPAPRGGGHALAFDARRGLTMLYGDRASDASTLWAWNGKEWRSFDGPGPGLRRHIKLAYDALRDRLVLYGGVDDSGRQFMSDTWEWDGARWTRAATEGPGGRSSYSLVYDPVRRTTVLFGGLSPDGPKSDTWSWDGVRWTKLADDGPSPRGEAGIVFDRRRRQIVLTGGMAYGPVAQPGRTAWTLLRERMPTDTWTFDGVAWHRLSGDSVARMAPLVADPRTGAPIMIGGEARDGVYHGDVWRWTDSWRAIAEAAVPARHGPAVALDTSRHRVVLFGGSAQDGSPLDDLWEWDGRTWFKRKE